MAVHEYTDCKQEISSDRSCNSLLVLVDRRFGNQETESTSIFMILFFTPRSVIE